MAPSPSPSKKLLIADLKPKLGPNSASSSSTTSTPPLPEKRTRDQPNLSDCHCCGRHIILANPKDRLQPLDSVWRIVLLCRKCWRNVSSGQTCPYCFQVTGNSGDLCTCRVCHRKIHKDCVRDYGKFTPWCYLGAEFEGFRVCVDCWVPELLKNSVQVSGRSDTGLKDKGEGEDLLENMEQNGKRDGDKKVKKAVKGKEQVLRGAKRPIGEGNLMDGSSGSLWKNDRDSMKAGNSNCSGETEVPDDAELAIQLHRVINSSPRILGGKPLGNASDIRIWKGLSYKRYGTGKRCSKYQELEISASSDVNGRMNETVENDSSNKYSGLIPYRRDRKRNIWQLGNENTKISEYTSSQQAALKNLHSDEEGVGCSLKNGSDTSENSISANTGRNSSCKDGGRFRQELISYKRHRFRKKESELNGQTNVSGDSSSCDNHGVAFKSECHQSDFANLNTISVVKTLPEKILPSGSDTETDRFHLKYAKRIPGAKNDSSFLHFGTFLNEIEVSAPAVSHAEAAFPVNDCEATLPNKGCAHSRDRYSFKYAKRVKSSDNSSSNAEAKMHSDAFVVKVGGSATVLTTNCFAESRTLSDISFDSLTVDLPQ